MSRMGGGMFAVAILAAAGCLSRAPSERVQPAEASRDGELRFAWDLGLKAAVRLASADPRRPAPTPQVGDLVPFDLTLQNDSDLPILLLSVHHPGAKVADHSWQRPLAGDLRTRPDGDQYTFTPAAGGSGTTEPVFNDGLLMPGESLAVRLRGRCLGPRVTFQIRALPLPGADLCRLIYAPTGGSSAADGVVPSVAEPVVFNRVTPETIRRWTGEAPSVSALDRPRRTVLFRPERTPAARSLTIEIPVYPRPARLPAAEAARRCGLSEPPPRMTYSTLLKAWIFEFGKRTCAVGERGIQEWPESDMEFFDLLDSQDGPIRIEMSETAAYALRNICVFDREASPRGVIYVSALQPGEATRFLGELERRRLSFEVAVTRDGSWAVAVR